MIHVKKNERERNRFRAEYFFAEARLPRFHALCGEIDAWLS